MENPLPIKLVDVTCVAFLLSSYFVCSLPIHTYYYPISGFSVERVSTTLWDGKHRIMWVNAGPHYNYVCLCLKWYPIRYIVQYIV
jgi:hypothetical protein